MAATVVHDDDDDGNALELLSQKVEALESAWDTSSTPPDLEQFLPEHPVALRHRVLCALVKVDLAYRWKTDEHRWTLEHYVNRFPELAEAGQVPHAILNEEYQIRRRVGDTIPVDDLARRFPAQAAELERLLGVERGGVSPAPMPMPVPEHRAESRADDLQPGQRVDDFELIVALGKGAFGTVFLARQVSMQRMVALKVTADRGTEPQTLAMLDHPNVVRVYDQRQLTGQPLRLLYMQYVPGGTLQAVVDRVRRTPSRDRRGKLLIETIDDRLDARGELPPGDSPLRAQLSQGSWPEAVCWVGARLAYALEYAHQRGVLHRDVKPANVLLAADGSPKLADFNISFCTEVEGDTPTAYFGGSLAYMSPEQLEATHPSHPRTPNELDGRSDVYSLAVLLWELLTGSRPFIDESGADGWTKSLDGMIDRRKAGVGQSARTMIPADCPRGLVEVLSRCLEPDRDRRYRMAQEAARQLELCLEPEVQRLLRPSADSWINWCRQRPMSALFAAALLPNIVCTVLNIGFNFAQWIRELERHLPEAVPIFYEAVVWVNPVLYTFSIALILYLAWPVVRLVRSRHRSLEIDPAALPKARARCVWIADFIAWNALTLWTLSGLVFPVWIHQRLLDHMGEQALAATGFDFRQFYVSFFASQLLSGIVSSMLTFFLLAVLCIRGMYPVLVEPAVGDPASPGRMAFLKRRSQAYLLAAIMGPLAAVAVGGIARLPESFIAGLTAVAFASLMTCWWLAAWLSVDADALVVAETPSGVAAGLHGKG